MIMNIKPIQVSNIHLEEYIGARRHFTTDEWLDLLLHSIGLNPEYFNKRGKFIQISRLIPHVENNFNFIELGPKGTGKSHIYSEFSPHGILISDARQVLIADLSIVEVYYHAVQVAGEAGAAGCSPSNWRATASSSARLRAA